MRAELWELETGLLSEASAGRVWWTQGGFVVLEKESSGSMGYELGGSMQ